MIYRHKTVTVMGIFFKLFCKKSISRPNLSGLPALYPAPSIPPSPPPPPIPPPLSPYPRPLSTPSYSISWQPTYVIGPLPVQQRNMIPKFYCLPPRDPTPPPPPVASQLSRKSHFEPYWAVPCIMPLSPFDH